MARHIIKYTTENQGGWLWNLDANPKIKFPQQINNAYNNTYRLVSVVLTLTRITNIEHTLYNQRETLDGDIFTNIIANKDTIISQNTNQNQNGFDICLKYNNSISEYTSNQQTIKEIHEFSNPLQSYYNNIRVVGYSNKGSYVNTSGQQYIFTFKDKPIIKSNSVLELQYLNNTFIDGESGISVGSNWTGCYVVVEDVKFETLKPSPASPDLPSPPSSNKPVIPTLPGNLSITITDRNCTESVGTNGIIKNYQYSFYTTQNIYLKTGVVWTILNGLYTRANASARSVIIEAIYDSIDYPTTDNVIIKYEWPSVGSQQTAGEAIYNITVNFCEKVKRQNNSKNIVASIRDIANYSLPIDDINYSTEAARKHYIYKNENLVSKTFNITGNTSIPLSQYFSLNRNNNLFTKEDDGTLIPYKFRFLNNTVYNDTYNTAYTYNAYKQDLDINIKIYCTPNNEKQFSYLWRDQNNNIISEENIPNVILLNQENIAVSDLFYKNENPEDGYCRAFWCYFVSDDDHNTVLYRFIKRSTSSVDGIFNGKIFDSDIYSKLPESAENKILRLIIKPAFYFNDNPNDFYTADMKDEYLIPQKFLVVKDSTLVPKLIFPDLAKSTPYTKLLLTDVERFGYEFDSLLINNVDGLNCRFGIKIGNFDLYLNDQNKEYFSNNKITKRLLCSIGKVIDKHNLYSDNLTIDPFIDILGLPQQIRIMYSTQNPSYRDSVNATHSTINAEKSSIWFIPIVKSGEYLTYFDSDRFYTFINKYHYFNNDIDIVDSNPQVSGTILKSEFWVNKANSINNYPTKMMSWLGIDTNGNVIDDSNNVSNPKVCWKQTSFTNLKEGDYIKNSNEPATYNYLYEDKFTHNKLHDDGYSYNTIAETLGKRNNLKQNYFDILDSLDNRQIGE